MAKRSYVCNAYKELRLNVRSGPQIRFVGGLFETSNKLQQEAIERSDYFGVQIHFREDPAIAEAKEKEEREAQRLAQLKEKHLQDALKKEKDKKKADEKAEQDAKAKTEKEAREKLEAEAKAKAEQDLKAEQDKQAVEPLSPEAAAEKANSEAAQAAMGQARAKGGSK